MTRNLMTTVWPSSLTAIMTDRGISVRERKGLEVRPPTTNKAPYLGTIATDRHLKDQTTY
jgi:hypothetical protein